MPIPINQIQMKVCPLFGCPNIAHLFKYPLVFNLAELFLLTFPHDSNLKYTAPGLDLIRYEPATRQCGDHPRV